MEGHCELGELCTCIEQQIDSNASSDGLVELSKASKAAEGLCKFVGAMVMYHMVIWMLMGTCVIVLVPSFPGLVHHEICGWYNTMEGTK